MANNTTSVHSIGFSSYYTDPYGNIDQIDGQSNMIFARRASAFKSYGIIEELANKSELPTKTSDLTNDSGFITSADVPVPSYIEDTDGNKIEADRTVEIVEQGEPHWTLTDGTNTYTLTGTRLNSVWESESQKYTLDG